MSCSNLVVPVDLGDRSYSIHIGSEWAQASLKETLGGKRSYIITDSNVQEHYLESLKASLGEVLGVSVVPAGESSKSLTIAEGIFGDLLKAKADRKTVIVALGGGVVGDLSGFIAAAFMRGVPFVQVPTSLLAMVDSSVGGKVAVNHALGKNMIGFFYQPDGVWMGTHVLKTLPEREWKAGLAEVVKYGVIMDAPFFSWLEDHVQDLLELKEEAVVYALEKSVRCKADVVSRDEKEGGLRAILNLGHTFGHAEEVLAGYGRVLHGEAVAAGMVAAMAVAKFLGKATDDDVQRVSQLLSAMGLPTQLTQSHRKDDFWVAMQGDKKSEAGQVKFVISDGIGQCGLPFAIDRQDVEMVLDQIRSH